MSNLNLIIMKQLHSILKDIALFLCVALPVICSICLVFIIYTWNSDQLLLAYYAVKLMAIVTAISGLAVLSACGLGLYLKERR